METKQYITVPFKITDTKEFKADDGTQYFTFEGYASTFGDIDLGADRVMPGAFVDDIDEKQANGEMLPVLWQHQMDMPLGVYTEMKEDAKGLYVKGRMPLDDTFVSGRVKPQMKICSVSKMSIGYIAKQFSFSDVDNNRIRNLEKVKLIEISLVTFPMNSNAKVTSMTKANKEQIEAVASLSDIETILHNDGYSKTEAKAIIAKVAEVKKVQRDAEIEAEAKKQRDAELKQAGDSFEAMKSILETMKQ